MSSISLRSYNREIEEMIDHGQAEEAVAHCMHILQSVPKHINTYRLMGKALLELHRYADGTDIFQRVLSSIPDDFVANIGMSIIRENEKNLDMAIWHMERAFESQPANSAVQSELRRLYGRRDGLEPSKVRMTRGALARMYAKGHLYRQAIGELRAALAEDAQRTDLQVQLADMYFQNGQEVEAVNACNNVLRKLPYCMDANRILAAILPKTERKEDAQAYRQRLVSLEPYYGKLDASDFALDKVPDGAIQLERLSYTPGQNLLQTTNQPDWVTSLGVAFEPPAAKQDLPDWLKSDQEKAASAPAAEQEAEGAQTLESAELPDWLNMAPDKVEESVANVAIEPSEGEIPDFLKDLGWEPSKGGPEAEQAGLAAETDQAADDTLIEKSKVPDWLKAMAEEDAEETPVGEASPWLQEKRPGASETIGNWLGSKPAPSSPEELKNLEDALKQASAGEASAPGGAAPAEEVELPDWLRETGTFPRASVLQPEAEAQAEEQPAESAEPGDMPDWLKSLDPARKPDTAELAAETPDWLKGLITEDQAASQTVIAAPEVQGALPAEETPDWPKNLGTEEHDTQPAQPAAELPAWEPEQPAAQAEPPTSETMIAPPLEAAAASAALAAELPDWLKGLSAEESDTQPQPTAELPAWEPEQPEAEMKTLIGQPEETAAAEAHAALPAEEIPDWLKGLRQEEPAAPPPAAELPAWEPEQPAAAELAAEAVSPTPLAEAAETAAVAAEIPDWLKGLNVEETTSATEQPEAEMKTLIGQPEETAGAEAQAALPAEEIPDWLKGLRQEEPAAPPPAAELPAWEPEQPAAAELAAEAVSPTPLTEAAETAAVAAEIPDWLKGLDVKEEDTQPAMAAPEQPEAEMKTLTGQPEQSAAEAQPALPAAEIPDWLKDLSREEPAAEAVSPTPLAEAAETAAVAAEIPDWLKGLNVTEEDTQPAMAAPERPEAEMKTLTGLPEEAAAEAHAALPAEEIPDWLKSLGHEEPTVEGASPTPLAEAAETAAVAAEIPDWLKGLNVEETTSAPEQPETEMKTLIGQPEETAKVALPAEEIPDWLKGLGQEEPAAQPAEFTQPVEPVAEIPVETPAAERPAAEHQLSPLTAAAVEAVPAAAQPAELGGFNMDDPDAMMAWLESLAAHHGVPQDQLVTRPEDRPETPEWLVEAGTKANERGELTTYVPTETTQPLPVESAPAAQVEPRPAESEHAVLEAPAAMEIPTNPEAPTLLEAPTAPAGEAVQPAEPAEAMPDWLKSLQTEAQETPAQEPAWLQGMGKEPAPAEDDTKPTRIKKAAETSAEMPALEAVPVVQPVAEAQPAAEIPAWLMPEVEDKAASPEAEKLTESVAEAQPAAEIPAWLISEAEDKAASAEAEKVIEPVAEAQPVAEPPAAEEIPAWLMPELEKEEPPVTAEAGAAAWMQDQQTQETPGWMVPPEETSAEEELPAWMKPAAAPAEKLDLNKATLRELENLPDMGFVMAQTILAHREVNGDFTSLDDLANVPGLDAQTVSRLSPFLEVKTPAPAQPAREHSAVPIVADPAAFEDAIQSLKTSPTEEAVSKLEELIQRQMYLPEIIQTLQKSIAEKPQDVYLHQALGDAYLNSDRLQDALDMYLAAEKLLR